MNKPRPLFRRAAVDAERTKTLGEIVLIQPISIGLLSGVALVVAAAVMALLVWGSYTHRQPVAGRLVPDTGLIKVYSPQQGTIVNSQVSEGQFVVHGEILYVIASERTSSALGHSRILISVELEKQRVSIGEQMRKTQEIGQDNLATLDRSITYVESELVLLESLIGQQRGRIRLAEETALRYQELQDRGFVSQQQLRDIEDSVFDQQAGLNNLQRDRSRVIRELKNYERERSTLNLGYLNQISELDRSRATTRQQLTDNEASRRFNVLAPATGTVTAVLGQTGQLTDGRRPLMSILPEGSLLQAELYAPSRAMGAVSVGDIVLLRYAAYPNQQFGNHEGVITSVSKIALSAAELSDNGTSNLTTEPMYRLIVDLRSQFIAAGSESLRLRAGMVVEADVLQETRRLYQWVLEPLYRFRERVY